MTLWLTPAQNTAYSVDYMFGNDSITYAMLDRHYSVGAADGLCSYINTYVNNRARLKHFKHCHGFYKPRKHYILYIRVKNRLTRCIL